MFMANIRIYTFPAHILCISTYNLHEGSEGMHKSVESEVQVICQPAEDSLSLRVQEN